MVAEVNKIIAGELLNHRSVVIPGVGTLYVAHRGARRLSRQKIAAPPTKSISARRKRAFRSWN